jgi:hypothetical protein
MLAATADDPDMTTPPGRSGGVKVGQKHQSDASASSWLCTDSPPGARSGFEKSRRRRVDEGVALDVAFPW